MGNPPPTSFYLLFKILLEMNTNDAKEYLARREIPQLFEVRDGADMFSTSGWMSEALQSALV